MYVVFTYFFLENFTEIVIPHSSSCYIDVNGEYIQKQCECVFILWQHKCSPCCPCKSWSALHFEPSCRPRPESVYIHTPLFVQSPPPPIESHISAGPPSLPVRHKTGNTSHSKKCLLRNTMNNVCGWPHNSFSCLIQMLALIIQDFLLYILPCL